MNEFKVEINNGFKPSYKLFHEGKLLYSGPSYENMRKAAVKAVLKK